MFDIGFIEICVIGVVALLVVGPKRLPKVAYEAGLWFGKIQRYMRGMRFEIERELHNYEIKQTLEEQGKELSAVKDLVTEVEQDLRSGVAGLMQDEEKENATAKQKNSIEQ